MRRFEGVQQTSYVPTNKEVCIVDSFRDGSPSSGNIPKKGVNSVRVGPVKKEKKKKEKIEF